MILYTKLFSLFFNTPTMDFSLETANLKMKIEQVDGFQCR